MATVYGVNNTLKRTGAVNTIEPELNGGSVRVVYDEYECSATAGGTVIELFGHNLPAEARVVDWKIDLDALGTSAHKIAFGTLEDNDEFMAYTDAVNSADRLNMTDDGISASSCFEIAAGSGQTIIITTSASATSAATGTIKVTLMYVTKGR